MTRAQRKLNRANARDASRRRRERNRAQQRCVNENNRGTHGPATHGVCCERCRDVHRQGTA